MNYLVSALTDIGLTKDTNQDAYSIRAYKSSIGSVVFAILCDGMGGLSRGEVASATVVAAFNRWADNELAGLIKKGLTENSIRNDWGRLVTEYNQKIKAYGSQCGVSLGTTLTAILLHNSLFKFAISFYNDDNTKGPLHIEAHPLAYMLMICDELQCWDRTAYGRNSRTELHPMEAAFDFSENSIRAIYYYDREEQDKIDKFKLSYRAWEKSGEQGKAPRLKAYSDMAEKEQRFTGDIERIVDTTDIPLTIVPSTKDVDRKSKHTYLSSSNFLHLYDFAVALNARYSYQGKEADVEAEALEKEFEELSLEYQLSNINQAKNFAKYLDALGCFYTDRPVDYEIIKQFTKEQAAVFAPMEHERWIREHSSMAWTPGDLYETAEIPADMLAQYGDENTARKALREQLRMHKLAMKENPTQDEIFAHYEALPLEEREKDYEPFNSMLKLIKKYDGLRIYQLD